METRKARKPRAGGGPRAYGDVWFHSTAFRRGPKRGPLPPVRGGPPPPHPSPNPHVQDPRRGPSPVLFVFTDGVWEDVPPREIRNFPDQEIKGDEAG